MTEVAGDLNKASEPTRPPIRATFFARWRVRVGYLLAIVVLGLANPTPESIAIGGIVGLIGLWIRALAAGHLHKQEMLTVSGPYAHTRNPLYFGALIGVFGAGFLCSRMGWIVQLALAILFCYRLILREERELSRTQGERFLAYCRAVPRLLPALKPRLSASGARPHWRESFAGQMPWWGAAVAQIAYAVTLRLSVAISVAVAGFIVFVTQKYLLKSYARPVAAPKEMR